MKRGTLLATLGIAIATFALPALAAMPGGPAIDGRQLSLLWIAVVFTFVNIFLKPIAKLLTLPLIVITLGLFALVVNAGLLAFTAWLTSDLDIDGFWPAFWGAAIISLVLMVAEAIFSSDA